MITCIVVDNDSDTIERIREFLKLCDGLSAKIAGVAGDLNRGMELIRQHNPDVVFVGTEINENRGLHALDPFFGQAFKTVFVSNTSDFAVEALNHSASGYLVKPFNFIQFRNVIYHVSNQLKADNERNYRDEMLKFHNTCSHNARHILLEVELGFIMESIVNIAYCVANQSYANIHICTNKIITVSRSLKDLEMMLPREQFYRTHKSYLVNIFYIRKFFRSGESYVLLKSGDKIPVSVRKSSRIACDLKKITETV